jgi:hypothetical protein
MPAFDNLTEEEVIAVVRYEREILGGEAEGALAAGGTEGATGEEAEGATGAEAGGGAGGEGESASDS